MIWCPEIIFNKALCISSGWLSQEMIKYSESYRWLPFRGAIANWVYLVIKDNQSHVFWISRHQTESSLHMASSPIHTGLAVCLRFISSAGSSSNLCVSNPVVRVLGVCESLCPHCYFCITNQTSLHHRCRKYFSACKSGTCIDHRENG